MVNDDSDLVDETPEPAAAPRRSARAPSLRTAPVREEGQRKRRRSGSEKSVFDLPPELKALLEEKGLSSEFKRTSYFGKEEDPDYHIGLMENGWETLSLKSFPEFSKLMPKGWSKDTFEKRGQILMIRPKELTDEARREDEKNANEQVKGQLATLKDAGSGEAQRTLVKVNRSYERGVPVD